MKPSPLTEHDHVDGPADAPVTLVEYGDYECPHCVQAFPVLEGVRELFRGKLRFVYRHAPKSAERVFAKQPAEASEFAAAHDRFWAMHARLFEQGERHEMEQLVSAALAVGLDGEACRRALLERTFAGRVRELAVASVQSGIIGTPTLFINGTRYENRIERPLLESAIGEALAADDAG